jgi:putative hydrolase of the HAD superfamily
VTIEADLGINREAFQKLFFGTRDTHSRSPMFECVVGRRDLADALADVLPGSDITGELTIHALLVRERFEREYRYAQARRGNQDR